MSVDTIYALICLAFIPAAAWIIYQAWMGDKMSIIAVCIYLAIQVSNTDWQNRRGSIGYGFVKGLMGDKNDTNR